MTKQRRFLNRLLCLILSLGMIFSCMEGLTLRASAEDPDVENDPVIEEETDDADEEWSDWTPTNALPKTAGNYKLMNNVTLSEKLSLKSTSDYMFIYKIDLNGKTITISDGGYIGLGDDKVSLTLKNGTITSGSNRKIHYFVATEDRNHPSGNVYFENVTFQNNPGTSGSAVDLRRCTGINTIKNCTFKNNSGVEGAALCIDNSKVDIIGTTFSKNSANAGGAIYVSGNNELNISGCTFTGNKANFTGGAIYSDNAKVTISGTTNITDNTAKERGGAIYAQGNALYISDTTIENNKVTDKADQIRGGGICCTEKTTLGSENICTVYLSGTLSIKNNTTDGTTNPSNIAVGKSIKVNNPIETSTPIGVYCENDLGNQDGVFASADYEAGNLKVSQFKCDVSGYRVLKEDKTLKFGWESTVTVSGGKVKTGTVTAASAKKGYGESVTVVADDPAAGMVFEKWTAEGVSIAEAEAKKTTLTFSMPRRDVSLSANFTSEEKTKYKVDVINGTADKTEAAENDIVTITENRSDDHNVFLRWETITSGVVFEDATKKVTTFKMPAKDVTVAANYTVYYDIQTVDCTVDKNPAKKGDVITVTAATVPGRVFEKWTCDNTRVKFASETAATTTFTMIDEPIKVTANYKSDGKTYYTVSYNMMGHGAQIPSQTVVSGNKADKPADPVADDWMFVGWYTEEEYTNEFNFDTVITKDIELFAKWGQILPPGPVIKKSPLDPVEVIDDSIKALYLVKGQKFTVPAGWTVEGKDNKKLVSISKKGLLKAKKEGEAEIKNGDRVLKLYISKPAFSGKSKSYKMEAGQSYAIPLVVNENLEVLWYSAAPDVAAVSPTGNVTAIAKGSAKITAYINGSAYNYTIKVTEPTTAKTRTLHLTEGAKKTISIKGLKKAEWVSMDSEIVKVDEKNKRKITAVKSGATILKATVSEEEIYLIHVTVDNITLTGEGLAAAKGANKYDLTIKAGESTTLDFAEIYQNVVFKSSKPETAFIDEDGNVYARKAGKAKFTAKVNGKTITVNVKVQ